MINHCTISGNMIITGSIAANKICANNIVLNRGDLFLDANSNKLLAWTGKEMSWIDPTPQAPKTLRCKYCNTLKLHDKTNCPNCAASY